MLRERHTRELMASELALLRALEDERWRTRVELAEETGLLPAAAAGMLRELAALDLVRRSVSWHSVGQWRITPPGIHELASQHGGVSTR
jgi:DNA-binding IclR family transcriptional regulator